MNTAPQCPTTSSSAPAREGLATRRWPRAARWHREQGHRHHEAGDGDEAEDGSGADIRALPGVARIDAGALDAEDHEDGYQHGVAHLRQQRLLRHVHAAEEILGEMRVVEEEHEGEDRHDQRHDSGDSDDGVDHRRLLDAAQDHEMERPDADQRDDDRGRRAAVAEEIGEETPEGRADQHPVEHVAQATAEPVTEGREEAHIVAKARLGVGEHAGVDVGPPLCQRLEHPRQHVHACAGNRPGDDRAKRPCRGGEPARQVEDAGADHRATTTAVRAGSESLPAEVSAMLRLLKKQGASCARPIDQLACQ